MDDSAEDFRGLFEISLFFLFNRCGLRSLNPSLLIRPLREGLLQRSIEGLEGGNRLDNRNRPKGLEALRRLSSRLEALRRLSSRLERHHTLSRRIRLQWLEDRLKALRCGPGRGSRLAVSYKDWLLRGLRAGHRDAELKGVHRHGGLDHCVGTWVGGLITFHSTIIVMKVELGERKARDYRKYG